MEDLSATIAQTRVQLLKQEAELEGYRGAMSAMRRLPLDVLGEVFLFISPSAQELVDIGLVCKRWREAALLTHRLWSSIELDDPRGLSESSYDRIVTWLNRSGEIYRKLEILEEDARGGLAFCDDSPWTIRNLESIQQETVFCSLPSSIRTLSLELPFADEAFKESSMAQFINLNIPVALLKNLAQLRVSCDWAGAHVLDMLSSCEHLESLEIDVWCQELELGPQQRAEGPSKAILPKLRTLIFRNLPDPTYLAHFVAPALTALDIQWEISPDMIPEGEFRGHLLRFLSQSGCQKSLHTLRLRESAFYCGELAAIILDLPSLQNLTLDRTHVQWYQFWEILREKFEALRDSGVDHEGGQWFPPLKVLELLRVPLQPLVLLSVFEFLYQRGPDPCKLVVSFETLQVPDQTQIESCWGLTAQRYERGRKATLRDFGISVSIASHSIEFV
ncbi:hypothetical protein NMY22_g13865 [Coprinellus aureogranulatus]|nr:hypothetical protein NMY22_g13865 [Coprinellus aureogranulatus]